MTWVYTTIILIAKKCTIIRNIGGRLWWVSAHYPHKYPLVVLLFILAVTSGFPTVDMHTLSTMCSPCSATTDYSIIYCRSSLSLLHKIYRHASSTNQWHDTPHASTVFWMCICTRTHLRLASWIWATSTAVHADPLYTHTSSDCLLCTCAMNMYVSGKTTTLVLSAHTQSI